MIWNKFCLFKVNKFQTYYVEILLAHLDIGSKINMFISLYNFLPPWIETAGANGVIRKNQFLRLITRWWHSLCFATKREHTLIIIIIFIVISFCFLRACPRTYTHPICIIMSSISIFFCTTQIIIIRRHFSLNYYFLIMVHPFMRFSVMPRLLSSYILPYLPTHHIFWVSPSS